MTEQTLDELLDEPMIRLLMARDHVHPQEVRRLFELARDRAIQGPFLPPAHVISLAANRFRPGA